MKQPTRTIASSFLLLIFIAAIMMLSLTGIVGAHEGEDHSKKVAVTSETEETLTDKAAVQKKVQQLKAEAKTELEAKRKNRESLTAEKRMKVCENRKAAINKKLSAFNNAADKHLTKLDSIYDKVLAFQEDKEVVVTNIDELKADAEAKKIVASESIAALKEIAVDVDCSDPETVVTLGAVRDAAHTARKALHDYRMSIKNIVVAIAHAQSDKSTEDSSSEDTTETSDTTTENTSESTDTSDTVTETNEETN